MVHKFSQVKCIFEEPRRESELRNRHFPIRGDVDIIRNLWTICDIEVGGLPSA